MDRLGYSFIKDYVHQEFWESLKKSTRIQCNYNYEEIHRENDWKSIYLSEGESGKIWKHEKAFWMLGSVLNLN